MGASGTSKLFLIVVDGMGDLPCPELGGKTPLEAAETPSLDSLASRGKAGLMITVGKGIAPESDVAVISLLGYDPFRFYTGRGPLEAIGAGLSFRKGELALRCNFATVNDELEILDRRAGRDLKDEESEILARAVQEHVKLQDPAISFTFRKTVGHRAVLVIRSEGKVLSPRITNSDPAYSNVDGIGTATTMQSNLLQPCRPMDESPEAGYSAAIVNEFLEKSRKVLWRHEVNRARVSEGKLPANAVLARDPGDRPPPLYSLSEKYSKRFVCLADMPVERGISKLAGMDVAELPPHSSDLRADCLLRLKALKHLFDNYDCFYVHIKGPDEPGHDGEAVRKAEMLEVVDRFFIKEIIDLAGLDSSIICVTADHSTPCTLKAHSDDPVPVVVAGAGISGDGLKKFSEKECSRGSLGTLRSGTELMPRLMALMG